MTSVKGFSEFIDELEEFADALEDIDDELGRAIDRGTGKTSRRIAFSASNRAPVDTGDLRADIAASKLSLGLWSVGSTKKYAPPTEYGSAPHPITPDTADWLRFKWKGDIHFRKIVAHPGTPAQPFLRPALNKYRSQLVEDIRDQIEEVMKDNL